MDHSCPITLTARAQTFLNKSAKERMIPTSRPLRIQQRVVNTEIHFDLYHDSITKEGEKVYKLDELSVLMDNDTAFQLVGSTLDVLEDNSLKFTHMETMHMDKSMPN